MIEISAAFIVGAILLCLLRALRHIEQRQVERCTRLYAARVTTEQRAALARNWGVLFWLKVRNRAEEIRAERAQPEQPPEWVDRRAWEAATKEVEGG